MQKDVNTSRRISGAVIALIAGLCLALLQPQPAPAAQVLYDDFNDPSNLVRTNLWFVSRSGSSNSAGEIGPGVTESLRFVDRLIFPTSNPKLFIARRFAAGTSALDRINYNVTSPTGKSGIQAKVTMTLCLVPAGGSLVQARIIGAGFHDGAVGGSGDETNDILAILRIGCAGTQSAEITWQVFKCTNGDCTVFTTLAQGSFGAASIGQEYTLHLQRVGNIFRFTVDGAVQDSPALPGTPTPNFPVFALATRIDAGGAGDFAVVATFDDVFVDVP